MKDAPAGDGVVLQLWNEVGIALSGVFALSSLMSVVHPDAAVMEVAESFEIEARKFSTDLYLDADVFAQLTLAGRRWRSTTGAARVLEDALRGFRRAGVDLDDETRERLRGLNQRESELSQAFSRGIRDGRRTTSVPASALAGLPEDYVAEHPADERRAGSRSAPTTPTRSRSSPMPATRRCVARSRTPSSTSAGRTTTAVLAELLEVREQKATLLGYDGWPSYDAEVKMIARGARIPEFIDEIADAAETAGRREIEELLALAPDEGEDVIDFSNWRHHVETLKRRALRRRRP